MAMGPGILVPDTLAAVYCCGCCRWRWHPCVPAGVCRWNVLEVVLRLSESRAEVAWLRCGLASEITL